MCTAIYHNQYFGRNLDLEYGYREQVVITPRDFPFRFRCGYLLPHHYALIGMATVANGEPLYYEATNERGLSMAGLSFPFSAHYQPKIAGKDNLAPFEMIPWILGQCQTVSQAKTLLHHLSIWALPFSRDFPLSPLHWIIADKETSIVVEPMSDGLHMHENPIGILTNEPPFPYHLHRLADIAHLTPKQSTDPNARKLYSNGLGAIGLPGDYSSSSRFLKAAFGKLHSLTQGSEVGQFFHLLTSVAMPGGSVDVDGRSEITRYSCCCDMNSCIYYYTTYNNSRIRAVRLQDVTLDCDTLSIFDLLDQPDIFFQN